MRCCRAMSVETLKKQAFSLVVLDEAQQVKNPRTQARRALLTLKVPRCSVPHWHASGKPPGRVVVAGGSRRAGVVGRRRCLPPALSPADREAPGHRMPGTAQSPHRAVHPLRRTKAQVAIRIAGEDRDHASRGHGTGSSVISTRACVSRWRKNCAR